MKFSAILFCALLLISAIGTVTANGNYTNTFAQDPTGGNATPWTLWILSGLIGAILIVIGLLKPRLYRMDYELSIILSAMAWPFLWYWTWGSLKSIDRIMGTGITTIDGIPTTTTLHILYTFPVLGYIGVGASLAAVFITILFIAQFNLFKENEENQKLQSQNQ